MWYSGWHSTGIIVLADNYCMPECTKITLLVITFPRASTKFQETSSISRSCRHPVNLSTAMNTALNVHSTQFIAVI